MNKVLGLLKGAKPADGFLDQAVDSVLSDVRSAEGRKLKALQEYSRKLAAGEQPTAAETEELRALARDGSVTEGALREAVAAVREFESILQACVRYTLKAEEAKAREKTNVERLKTLQKEIESLRASMRTDQYAAVTAGACFAQLRDHALKHVALFADPDVGDLVQRHVRAAASGPDKKLSAR